MGVFNPPPTVGVQGVLDYNCMVCLVCQVLNAKFSIYAQYAQAQISYNPSFVLPRRVPVTGAPLQKSVFCAFGAILSELLVSRNALQKSHRKNIEKSAKIEDFGFPKPSQNPSKILPKSMSKKTYNFHSFLTLFF